MRRVPTCYVQIQNWNAIDRAMLRSRTGGTDGLISVCVRLRRKVHLSYMWVNTTHTHTHTPTRNPKNAHPGSNPYRNTTYIYVICSRMTQLSYKAHLNAIIFENPATGKGAHRLRDYWLRESARVYSKCNRS